MPLRPGHHISDERANTPSPDDTIIIPSNRWDDVTGDAGEQHLADRSKSVQVGKGVKLLAVVGAVMTIDFYRYWCQLAIHIGEKIVNT